MVEHHVMGGVVGILGMTLIGERLFTVGIIHGRVFICGKVKLGDGTLRGRTFLEVSFDIESNE